MVLRGICCRGLLRLVMGIEHWLWCERCRALLAYLFNLAVLPGRVVRIRWSLSG